MTTSRPTQGVARLAACGQSPWYDNLTRPIARGGLDALMAEHAIVGVTSNPTIFEKAILGSDAYDDDLRRVGGDVESRYWNLVLDDIAHAADRLVPVYETTARLDGYVSVEVDPRLARDTAGTIDQARRLAERLDRPNVMIKIPATLEGLPAITETIAAGINVNVTLIFSLDRYAAVIDAFLRGLEARLDRSQPVDAIASVASFFVSRVDTETDARLPDGHPLRGHAAVANAKLAYELFEAEFASDRWARIAARGANEQRPLWASTSTKNAAYSPTLYVDELAGPRSVNTLADASIAALAAPDAPAIVADAVRRDVDGARATMAALTAAGVDFADVTATLEREGVEAFAASFSAALSAVAARSHAA